jgi:acyl dehydratase
VLEAFGVDPHGYLDDPLDRSRLQRAPRAMLAAFSGRRLPEWRGPAPLERDLTQALAMLGLSCIGTGISQCYRSDITAGDCLEERIRVHSVSERKRTRVGAGYFITIRSEFTTDRSGPVGEQDIRLLAFGAPDMPPDDASVPDRAPASKPVGRYPLPERRLGLDRMDIIACAVACGDFNPAHCDPELARSHGLEDSFADVYSGLGFAYSYARPAKGERVSSIDLTLTAPCYAGDTLALTGERLDHASGGTTISLTGRCRTGIHIRGTVTMDLSRDGIHEVPQGQ